MSVYFDDQDIPVMTNSHQGFFDYVHKTVTYSILDFVFLTIRAA